MRILIYGINYFPELIGIGKYTGEMAEWLADHGHEVQVVTAPPYYPAWKVSDGFSGHRYETENVSQDLRILRCPIWVPKRVGGLTRILLLLSFALSSTPALLWLSLRRRPDAIIVIAPSLFCAPIAWLAARLTGAKCWLHVQDFEIDAAFELGILSGGRVRNVIHGLERFLLRRFDRVSSITGKMVQRLLDKGSDHARTCLFANWVDIDAIFPLDRASSYRDELDIGASRVVALYSGNMGKKQGIEELAQVARRLANCPDILFVFCGTGVTRPDLEQACFGLPNVRFINLQPTERLNDLLNLADIHLLPQREKAADLLMPCKLTGMMASGRAIVATARQGTEVATVLAGRGLLTTPGSIDGFADAVEQLAKDPSLRAEMGHAARKYAADELSSEKILRSFEVVLSGLARP